MKEFWNERYAQKEFVYGENPNRFLIDQLDGLNPGKIIFTCEGEGRNAVFAATKDWEVEAFDYSEKGKEKAIELAEKNNVNIEYKIGDFNEIEFPEDSADAVAMIFNHFPPELRKTAHDKVQKWLKKGGVLIMEAFTPEQLNNNSGGPKDEKMLYTKEILQKDFSDMKIELLETLDAELDEGKYHKGQAALIRLVAVKEQ